MSVNDLQQKLVMIFYAPKLGGTAPILLSKRAEYVKLVVHLKKWMAMNGLSFLQAFITASLPEGGVEPRKILATKEFVCSLTRNASWKRLHEVRYKYVAPNLLRHNLIAHYVTMFMEIKAEQVQTPEEIASGARRPFGYLRDRVAMPQAVDELLKFLESV
jgi:hypothetical protein